MTTPRDGKGTATVILVAAGCALGVAAGYVGVPRPVFLTVLGIVIAVLVGWRIVSRASDSTKEN